MPRLPLPSLLTLLAAVLWAGLAGAQTAYVQIEAHPSRAEALSRAEGYAVTLEDVNAFQLSRRWFGVALGPFASPAAAEARLRALRAAGRVPRDSYVEAPGRYGARVWPPGAG